MMLSRLKRSTKRLLALLALIPPAVVLLGTLYMVGMDQLEGKPRTFLQSIQWASETLTRFVPSQYAIRVGVFRP